MDFKKIYESNLKNYKENDIHFYWGTRNECKEISLEELKDDKFDYVDVNLIWVDVAERKLYFNEYNKSFYENKNINFKSNLKEFKDNRIHLIWGPGPMYDSVENEEISLEQLKEYFDEYDEIICMGVEKEENKIYFYENVWSKN